MQVINHFVMHSYSLSNVQAYQCLLYYYIYWIKLGSYNFFRFACSCEEPGRQHWKVWAISPLLVHEWTWVSCLPHTIFSQTILLTVSSNGGLIDCILHVTVFRSRIFHSNKDITITGEGLQNLGFFSVLTVYEQGGIFIVPYLVLSWYHNSVYTVSSEDCHVGGTEFNTAQKENMETFEFSNL